MEGTWARIERWLAEFAPDVLKSLQPAATEEQISNAEAALGVTLPEEVRASYRIHDGQSPDGPGLMDAWEFLSLSRIVDRKSTRLNSSHANISYAVFCLKKKNNIRKIRK